MQSILEKGGILFALTNKMKNFSLKEFDKDQKEKAANANVGSAYLKGSISEYTKDLIMTFPTLCDNSLPATTASLISKATERNIVSMLEMLFASIQINGTDAVEMLSKLHKNISTSASIDDVVDALEKLGESYKETPEIKEAIRTITEAVKRQYKSYPISSFSENSLNDYVVYNVYGKTIVREDKTTSGKDENDDKVKDSINYLGKILMDQDVKKVNELSPTLMIVKYNEITPDGSNIKDTFVTGVKSRLISTDASDIVERLIAKNKTKLSFLNLIRATTGEINFVSDFLLCTKQAKIDAKNAVKKGPAAKMWNVLEFRAAKNTKNKVKGFGNDASAITTLVINQETVNLLKKEYDFDLEKITNTKMIMDAYNLLCICICDESIEVAKFLYAGNDSYEQQAYSFLEKEGKDNTKKIINLLNSTGR